VHSLQPTHTSSLTSFAPTALIRIAALPEEPLASLVERVADALKAM